jgi:uncharacterized protein with NAD-binding domain and iron-sulfur cluster
MAERPNYIYLGGSPLQHTPMHLNQSDMYGFFVKGDLAKLQRSIDQSLNTVAAGRMNFKVLSPFVMLTFTHVYHAQSSFAADYNKGWGKEVDIITWIMVGQMDVVNGKEKLSRIFSYPFHVWVDVPMAISIGREIFGYPKNGCEYTMPALGGDPDQFTLATEGFTPYNPNTELATHPLLEVTATDKSKPHRPINGFLELIKEGFKLLQSEPAIFNLDAAGVKDVLSMLLNPRVDQIFLKQFPDATGVKAVYQAVIAAPAAVDKVHNVRLLGYTYKLNLHAFDQFPLNETLGLQLGEQDVLLPFNIYFDFTVGAGEELVNNSSVQPEKIAILGGGVSAMAVAFFLTDQPGWQNNFDITVYQMGWRLGGKGASGRNANYGQRIEEHGLHIWFGFYENAFAMMQKAYDLLERPPGAPLRTWQDAFQPQHFVALTEFIDNQWKVWPVDTPIKPGVPGTSSEELTLWQVVVTVYEWIKEIFGQLVEHHKSTNKADAPTEHGGLMHSLAMGARAIIADVEAGIGALELVIKQLPSVLAPHQGGKHPVLHSALTGIRQWLDKEIVHQLDGDDKLRRLYIMADLGITSILGMLEDGVLKDGFDVINDIDFYDWLAKHGANKTFTVHSAPVRGFYDLVFAYENGDYSKPNIEAGTMLRGMLKVAFAYQGGMMWKMQAGMGDTIFTPLYQVLKKRGVKFKFFHKVEELIPNGDSVGEIRITKQVDLTGDYDPFVNVKGLDCWPSAPNFQYIDPKQTTLLQANGVNLESNWSNWLTVYQQAYGKPLPTITLKQGVDFDHVVFGIGVAPLVELCPKLLAQSPALKATAENVKAVATEAYQVWLTKTVDELGWRDWPKDGQEPVLSGFTEPFDTWAPMDQLLPREDWPPNMQPKNVSYFCSAMPMDKFPPSTDTSFPATCAARVKQDALNQLGKQIYSVWPNAATKNSFQWSWLLAPDDRSGAQRFDNQFWRANIDPSERYVISVVGSTKYRLDTDGSGFKNLFLTGDWIKTGLNAGCVEAAAMAGMQTSRAISGYPVVIKGESGF